MGQANMISKDNSAARNGARAIVACTDPEIRQVLTRVLDEFGLQSVVSETLDDAKSLLKREETAIAFVQPNFRKGSFREVLRVADGPRPRVPVIVCSEFYDKELYIEAMSLGAFDYLAFPYRREEVEWVIGNAVNRRSLSQAARA